jgi:hypothetical protein
MLSDTEKELIKEFRKKVTTISKMLQDKHPTGLFTESAIKLVVLSEMKKSLDPDSFDLAVKVLDKASELQLLNTK